MLQKLLLYALIGFAFGILFGFLGVWVDHRNESEAGPRRDHWTDFLIIPSTPGNIITWQTYGAYDWGIDETWDYRIPITLWNGVSWSVFSIIIGSLRFRLIQRQKADRFDK